MHTIRTVALCCLLMGLAVVAVAAANADWNRFRGPNGSGLSEKNDFSGTPAIDGSRMWLRSDAYLYCIQKSNP